MNAPNQLLIIGAGGAGVEALWVARRMLAVGSASFGEVRGFVDDNPDVVGRSIDGVTVVGTTGQIARELNGTGFLFHCALGNNRQRQKVAEVLEAVGGLGVELVDPSAIVAPHVKIGAGSFVGPLSIIAPYATVGRFVLINTHVGVGHHAVIGDFAQLCPGVRVSGGCKIDSGAFLGSNAVVHPGLTIGEGAVIGASSFVIRSVKPRFSMMGVPARIVSRPAENGPDAQT